MNTLLNSNNQISFIYQHSTNSNIPYMLEVDPDLTGKPIKDEFTRVFGAPPLAVMGLGKVYSKVIELSSSIKVRVYWAIKNGLPYEIGYDDPRCIGKFIQHGCYLYGNPPSAIVPQYQRLMVTTNYPVEYVITPTVSRLTKTRATPLELFSGLLKDLYGITI